jgi:hypothetical protein
MSKYMEFGTKTSSRIQPLPAKQNSTLQQVTTVKRDQRKQDKKSDDLPKQELNRAGPGTESKISLTKCCFERYINALRFQMAAIDKEPKKAFERLSLVWVRIKGFPVWPAVIVTMPDVPEREIKVSLII